MQQTKEMAKAGKRMGKKVMATDTAQDVVGAMVNGLEEVAVDKADDVAENVKTRAARAGGRSRSGFRPGRPMPGPRRRRTRRPRPSGRVPRRPRPTDGCQEGHGQADGCQEGHGQADGCREGHGQADGCQGGHGEADGPRPRPSGRVPRRPRPSGRVPRRPRPSGRVPRRPRPSGRVPRRPRPSGRVPRRPRRSGAHPPDGTPPAAFASRHGDLRGMSWNALLNETCHSCERIDIVLLGLYLFGVPRYAELVELRTLEGPNLYFPRPAIKLTVAIPGWLRATPARLERMTVEMGAPTTLDPGERSSDQRRRFVARIAAHATREIARRGGHPSRRARTHRPRGGTDRGCLPMAATGHG